LLQITEHYFVQKDVCLFLIKQLITSTGTEISNKSIFCTVWYKIVLLELTWLYPHYLSF